MVYDREKTPVPSLFTRYYLSTYTSCYRVFSSAQLIKLSKNDGAVNNDFNKWVYLFLTHSSSCVKGV